MTAATTIGDAEQLALFRDTVRRFCQEQIAPFRHEWSDAGVVPRSIWQEAGKLGILGMAVPEQHGGAGLDDFRFNAVIGEELVKSGRSLGPVFPLHNDIVLPYLIGLATDEQARRWLPGMVTGDTVGAIAMTEPGAGSDLKGITTTARLDGDAYVLSGAKTFISNGLLADLVVVVARTAGSDGLTLLVVERDMPGFRRGRNLDKIGRKAQDTAELFFDDVRVPLANRLGLEGQGFRYLVDNLPQERLSIAVSAVAAIERCVDITLDYVKTREAFGQPIGRFQNTRFELAEMATQATVARAYIDQCVEQHRRGSLDAVAAAKAKVWTTELEVEVESRCLQLHGGYGYMSEYEISQLFLDGRVQTIHGGTSEIMLEIIGRSLGL